MLHFEKTKTSDISHIRKMENDPDNKHFIFTYSVAEHQDTMKNEDNAHLKLIDNQGVTVGFVILRGLTNENKSIELKRIVIQQKQKGYGKTALRMVQQFAFESLGAHRLWLDVFTDNPRAQHVYRAVGFVEEGTKRECIKSDEGYRSLILFSMLRQEYFLLK